MDGYLGSFDSKLPSDYFDMVFSVSVIEHVPLVEYEAFFADMHRILKPGGVHIHSYDVWWLKDLQPMFQAVETAGFEWLEPREDVGLLGKLADDAGQRLPGQGIGRGRIRHPCIVLEVFSHSIPMEKRVLHNWVSIHMGARRPL